MDCLEAIRKRRSIRKFQDRDIPDPVLQEILETCRWTPSWGNTQCWELVLVRDRAVQEKIQAAVSSRNPAFHAIVRAPVLFLVCGRLQRSGFYKDESQTKFGDWFMYDLGLFSQNLCLAAQNHGLGTVIVGMFDHDRVGAIVNLPEGHEVVALIPLGYPDQHPAAPKRRETGEFVHQDSF